MTLCSFRGCAVSFFLAASSTWAISPGAVIPSLAATNASGAPILVSGAAVPSAKLTYIDFWASWCGPCKQSFPWMEAMNDKYGKNGLRIVAITVDKKREDAEKFLKQLKPKFEIGFDPEGKTASALQIKAMPTSLLVDEKGKVLFVHNGFKLSDTDALEAQMRAALEATYAPKK